MRTKTALGAHSVVLGTYRGAGELAVDGYPRCPTCAGPLVPPRALELERVPGVLACASCRRDHAATADQLRAAGAAEAGYVRAKAAGKAPVRLAAPPRPRALLGGPPPPDAFFGAPYRATERPPRGVDPRASTHAPAHYRTRGGPP
jgi:hypothetical protein